MPLPLLVIERGRNEHDPLRFPDVFEGVDEHGHTRLFQTDVRENSRMAGDYRLADWPSIVGEERKGSISELRKNIFSADRRRAMAAFRRFAAEYEKAYLLFDFSPAAAFKSSPHYDEGPPLIQQRTFELAAELNLHLLWLPPGTTPTQKIQQGELALRILWSDVIHKLKRNEVDRLRCLTTPQN